MAFRSPNIVGEAVDNLLIGNPAMRAGSRRYAENARHGYVL
jgi:hypothetical protein